MEDDIYRRLRDIIPESMSRQGEIVLDSLLGPIKDILNRRRFPDEAFTESQVEMLFKLLSSMDSDKDSQAARVGEREGRTVSPLLDRLSTGFNHGIGRSGHLTAPQPKAVGATQMQIIANQVALDAIKRLGLPNVRAGFVAPLSTGMSIGLVLSALRRENGVRKVLYPRIDHTSPKRGIALAGLEEIMVGTILEDDGVQADLGMLESIISKKDDYALLATTTFFPPRESDPVKEMAKICQNHDIPFVINNAYGVQSSETMASISSAIDAGRVDAIVQSSDKNFMTPVGGSIIVTPDQKVSEMIAETYAGRATAAPVVQTLAALLLLGREGYEGYREQQQANLAILYERMTSICDKFGQRLLSVDNPVAYAMTMDGLDCVEIGARLYNRRVTGPRAVPKGDLGSCIDDYPHSYLVMNAAIGARRNDVETATVKLNKELSSYS